MTGNLRDNQADLPLHVSNEGLPTLRLLQREGPRLPFTARIERAHSDRARSASKKGTWPLPSRPSQRDCSEPGLTMIGTEDLSGTMTILALGLSYNLNLR
jgi:hypothetical protein